MPFDPRTQAALNALRQPIAEFRAAVEASLHQAEAFVLAQAADAGARAQRAAAELGDFGAAHIDAGKFAAFFPAVAAANPEAFSALRLARSILRSALADGDSLFVAEVTEGVRLGATIDNALASAGSAFGAIVVTELVRTARYHAAEHEMLFDAQEFRTWNRAERRFAPPIVVEVDGADLHAGALLDFADGREKVVVVVRGASPPAPLARCITPGTYVLQATDAAALGRMASFDGPAIAALMPQGAALFTHDPDGGHEPWQRLSVQFLPAAPERPVGGFSVWQMTEDLKVLADLARTPFNVPGAAGAKGTPALGADDAVDRIANWLLDASGLTMGQAS